MCNFVLGCQLAADRAFLAALKVLHTHGWVHRDISAGNVLVDTNGQAKLVDLEYASNILDRAPVLERVVSLNRWIVLSSLIANQPGDL